MKTTRKWQLPHIYIILLSMVAFFTLLSYIVPAGQFERVEGPTGAQIIKPGSFTFTEQSPVTFMEFMLAIPSGLVQSATIIFGGLMLGGMFSVFSRTGIIDLGVHKLSLAFAKRGIWIIPVLMTVFAVFTTFSGAIELTLIYLPIILPLILKLGFDRITAAAVALCSTVAGFAVALSAPATTGLAQKLSDLPLYSGIGYRAIIFVFFLAVGIWYVMRYAKRVRNNPETGILYDEREVDVDFQSSVTVVSKATPRQVVAVIAMLIGFIIMFYGMIEKGWYFLELAGLYMMMGCVVGLIAGLKPVEICEAFSQGFKDILVGVLIIGIARGVAVVLNEGNILDTIVYSISELISGLPSSFTAVAMLIVQAVLNFLIPSGSGQAMITMPIMTGLSDLAGVTRQTAVLAFQLGDGFSNIFYPTSGYFIATIALAKISWEKWVRFVVPLLLIWYSMAAVFLIIAQWMKWGPF
ncbi:YfcC family protein [Brevibacillus sp. NRS-1366]|uniref:YfcC family protein n=1 Tax=Brevibacillus sp. NRS-1366 TaxID=3233899 RepID=UPI003D1ECD7D